MKNVLFTCAALGASGYSEASRNYISALNLYKDQINLAVQSVNFEKWSTDQNLYRATLEPLLNKKIKPDVQIIHMTPENYPKYKIPGIKNIGYTVWETTRLPPRWVNLCNQMDAILVPCEWNVEVFKNCGVTVPVKKVEHTIDLGQFQNVQPFDLGSLNSKFKFYSIFQWTERKNPSGIIKAFISEFSKNENVSLILKTYHLDNSPSDRQSVERVITELSKQLHTDDHPPINLIHKMLSRSEVLALHSACDVMVLPHRAEGWSCTHFESLAMGNPTIGTRFGGNTEFMTDDNSLLLDYQLTPVSGMPWPIYSGKGMWADPSLDHLRKLMRRAYTDYTAEKYNVMSQRISL